MRESQRKFYGLGQLSIRLYHNDSSRIGNGEEHLRRSDDAPLRRRGVTSDGQFRWSRPLSEPCKMRGRL